MNSEIFELEKILNQEIEAYSKLEEYITDKKNCLIKGDIEKIKTIDSELEKYNFAVEKLEEKRKKIYPDNLTLKQIIERIENRDYAEKMSVLRTKIKNIALNIQKQNTISMELLKYSMKVVENSIITIANVLVPEGSSYNKKGFANKRDSIANLSSVEHEA